MIESPFVAVASNVMIPPYNLGFADRKAAILYHASGSLRNNIVKLSLTHPSYGNPQLFTAPTRDVA